MQQGDVIAGRYEVQNKLGNGAMGVVFKSYDRTAGQTVAIKAIKPEILNDNPELAKRFIREGRALEQLDHPHIVKIFDIHNEGDDYYIIMEYVDGLTLSAQIQKHTRLPIQPTVQVSYALASALDYIHSAGIIHRDIKPSNIMFTAKGSPRLMDFGVAHLSNATPMTAPGSVLGTLSYVSPEIIYGGKATVKSDVWALGMTIYKMLTGKLPFGGSTPAVAISEILSQPVSPVIVERQDAPPLLAGLVDMMLQKDPQLRIDSMARVKEHLKALMA